MLKFEYSRETSTSVVGLFWISSAFGNLIFGHLSTKYKKRKVFYLICSILLCNPLIIIYCDASNMNIYIIGLLNILTGLGCGSTSIIFAIVREYNDFYECSDIASGYVNTMGTIAGFVVQWLIGVLMDINWTMRYGKHINDGSGQRKYNIHDYNYAFIIIPIIVAINFFTAILIKETNGQSIIYQTNETSSSTSVNQETNETSGQV
eukprot:266848_1